jgi:hypothetical protein
VTGGTLAQLREPYPTYELVGVVLLVGVLLFASLVVYVVVRLERDRRRREQDVAHRNPANCTCYHDTCDADTDWQDYVDGLPSRRLCLPCLYRPHGTSCYAAYVHEWSAR